MVIAKIGKKTREWQKARRNLIKEELLNNRFIIKNNRPYGICADCFHSHYLTPDHKIKRSLGGAHIKENIDWICNEFPCMCHSKRDNLGDPMKRKPESKKAQWAKPHACKNCKETTSMLICNHCKKLSI